MIILREVHPRFDPVPSIKTFIEALSNFLNVTNTNTTNTTTTTNTKRKKAQSSAPLSISESTFRLIQCHHAANIFFSSIVERRSSWQKAGSITLEDRRWGIVEVYFQLQLVDFLISFRFQNLFAACKSIFFIDKKRNSNKKCNVWLVLAGVWCGGMALVQYGSNYMCTPSRIWICIYMYFI